MLRIASTLLLSLLVVAAQQAALLHEIDHGFAHGAPLAGLFATANDRLADGKTPGKEASSSYCEKCFQFAHVCGAVFSSPVTVVFIAARAQAVRAGVVAELAADPPANRSRGPPVLL